jgi:hypothetical protein
MTGLSRIWLVLAVLFALGNLAVPVIAPIVWREPMHLAVHVLLAVLGAAFARHLLRRRDAHRRRSQEHAERPAAASEFSGRLSQLEGSIDAVAIEVERIGEGQRFVTRVLTGNDPRAPGEGTVAPPARETMPRLHTTPLP